MISRTALEAETLGKILPQGLGEENEKRLALIHSAAAVAYHLLCKDMVDLSFITIVSRESNAEGQVAIENPVALRPGAFTKGFMRRHLRSSLVPSVAEEIFYGFDNCTKVTARTAVERERDCDFLRNNAQAMSDENSEFGYVPTGHVIEVNDFLRSNREEYILPSTTLERYARADEETRRLMEAQHAAPRDLLSNRRRRSKPSRRQCWRRRRFKPKR